MTASTSGSADASQTIDEAKAHAEAAAAEVGGTLKQQGRYIRDEAKDEIQRFTDQRKDQAASFIKDVANALRDVTSKLDEQGHDRIARYTGVAADKLSEVGDDIPQRDLGDLLRQAERLAREQPAVYIGALFIAGFGAARFLRASGEATDAPDPDYPEERGVYDGV
jgi:ABC-type transporter Mla subunit MlaD